MASSLTTIINFNPKLHHSSHSLSLSSNFIHFHFRFHSAPRRFSAFRVSLANQNPKFDFNLQNYNKNKNNNDNDDDNDDELNRRRRGRRTWKRGKKSDQQQSKQRPWWNVEFGDDDYDEDDERGILNEIVDRLLVIKVFRSYGWFSPFILISLVLSTGPKAFLMAFSVFFGLSLLIYAFQKLQERLADSPLPENTCKRSKFGRRNNTFVEEEADQDGQQSNRDKKRDYQSGAARNNGSFYTIQNSNGASGNYFGGWEELVRDDETQGVHRSSEDNGRPNIMEEEETKIMQEEKLSRSMQDGDLPLLLRLLVSVFPFLASWTNLL